MGIFRKKDPFCAYYGLTDEEPTGYICAVCGDDIWPGEAAGWTKNGKICHAYCVEKEELMEALRPDKPVAEWTAKEMRDFCAARVAANGGTCRDGYENSCPLFGVCGQCPDEWDLEKEPMFKTPVFSGDELAVIRYYARFGATHLWRTNGHELYFVSAGDVYLIPYRMFPSIFPGKIVNLSDIAGL